jgi:hypothetical protein
MAEKCREINGIRRFAPAAGGPHLVVGEGRRGRQAACAAGIDRLTTVWAIFARLAVTIPQPT